MPTRNTRNEVDEEAPEFEIGPQENVFSYFMIPKRGDPTKSFWDHSLASFLVIGVLLMQGWMLYCVYSKVVVNNTNWVAGIMSTGEDWNLVAPASKCRGSSLCTVENGTFTCAPPSVQLTGRWDELDLDGDGVWTREEVMEAREDLKCKYGVDPLEVFEVFIQFTLQREKLIWIHPDVRERKAIQKAYFTFAAGDIIMCGYRNPDMCPNLLRDGVFHTPLKDGTAPRVGTTIESALDYCTALLEPRGTCEKLLPSTYSTWKIESVTQCDKPKYERFVYKNPGNGVIKSLLSVDYKARMRYERAKGLQFQLYKSLIIGMWILGIVSQFRNVWQTVLWVFRFPDKKEWDDEEEEITGISMGHRISVGIICLIRLVMLLVLAFVGLSFLSRQTDYIGLLLDGLALIFIIEVAEIVYSQAISTEINGEHEEVGSMKVTKFGIGLLNRQPAMADLVWLVFVMGCTFLFMQHLDSQLVDPLFDALSCTCLNAGEKCREAQVFSHDFWEKYWGTDVPATYQAINNLKGGFSVWRSGAKPHSMLNAHHQSGSSWLSLHHNAKGHLGLTGL